MTGEDTEKPDIVGKPISELGYDDFKPYTGQYVIYATRKDEEGKRVPTEIVAVGKTIADFCVTADGKSRAGTGLIKLLEQDNWRNYDFLVGKK